MYANEKARCCKDLSIYRWIFSQTLSFPNVFASFPNVVFVFHVSTEWRPQPPMQRLLQKGRSLCQVVFSNIAFRSKPAAGAQSVQLARFRVLGFGSGNS